MAQASFLYDTGVAARGDALGLAVSVGIFVDSAALRSELADDAVSAGFRVSRSSGLDSLGSDGSPLPDLVLVDCPEMNGRLMASLSRLDMTAARTGAHVVVSTTLSALDDVFACMDQCDCQILVNPHRAERVIALGRALAGIPAGGVRELSDEDRLTLLRLAEQVAQLAGRLDRLSSPGSPTAAQDSIFRFASPESDFRGADDQEDVDRLVRATRPPLPDPRLIRRIIRQRQLRGRFFDAELFADPAWDMLLDLTAARVEHTRVSVTSLCIASGVPPTTALRWIRQLTEAGLVTRVEDETDRRRAFITLTDKGADGMARYFAELGRSASRLI